GVRTYGNGVRRGRVQVRPRHGVASMHDSHAGLESRDPDIALLIRRQRSSNARGDLLRSSAQGGLKALEEQIQSLTENCLRLTCILQIVERLLVWDRQLWVLDG